MYYLYIVLDNNSKYRIHPSYQKTQHSRQSWLVSRERPKTDQRGMCHIYARILILEKVFSEKTKIRTWENEKLNQDLANAINKLEQRKGRHGKPLELPHPLLVCLPGSLPAYSLTRLHAFGLRLAQSHSSPGEIVTRDPLRAPNNKGGYDDLGHAGNQSHSSVFSRSDPCPNHAPVASRWLESNPSRKLWGARGISCLWNFPPFWWWKENLFAEFSFHALKISCWLLTN